MKAATELDLADLKDILEGFVSKLDSLSQKDKIDLAARLKPVAKACEVIDKAVKELVKNKLNHAEGVLKGELFQAELTIVPIDRFEQKVFQEEHPNVYARYLRHDEDERVSFKLR